MDALRALFVEDAPDDLDLMVRELRRAGLDLEVRCVETAPELEAALDDGPWHIVVTDHQLPRFSGPAALALIRRRAPDVPVIAISGVVGEETIVEMVRGGAVDYVLKSNLTRFAPAVERAVREVEERSARRRAEAQVERERRYIVSLIESSPAYYVAVAADGTMLMMNPALLDALGRASDEVVGAGYLAMCLPPDEHDRQTALLHQIVTGSGVASEAIEHDLVAADGKRIPVAWHYRAVRDDAGNLEFIYGLGIDVGGVRRARQELEASERHCRALFDAAPAAMWEVDFAPAIDVSAELGLAPDDIADLAQRDPAAAQRLQDAVRVININRALVRMLGAENPHDLLERWYQWAPADHRSHLWSPLAAVLRGETSGSCQTEYVTLNGDEHAALEVWTVVAGDLSGGLRLAFCLMRQQTPVS